MLRNVISSWNFKKRDQFSIHVDLEMISRRIEAWPMRDRYSKWKSTLMAHIDRIHRTAWRWCQRSTSRVDIPRDHPRESRDTVAPSRPICHVWSSWWVRQPTSSSGTWTWNGSSTYAAALFATSAILNHAHVNRQAQCAVLLREIFQREFLPLGGPIRREAQYCFGNMPLQLSERPVRVALRLAALVENDLRVNLPHLVHFRIGHGGIAIRFHRSSTFLSSNLTCIIFWGRIPNAMIRNTLFVHLLVWHECYTDEFLRELLTAVFDIMICCECVIFVIPPRVTPGDLSADPRPPTDPPPWRGLPSMRIGIQLQQQLSV